MDMNAVLGTVATSIVIAFLARTYIMRSAKELDEAVDGLSLVRQELAVVATKLQGVEKCLELVLEHDRKIAKLEARVFNGSVKAGRLRGDS